MKKQLLWLACMVAVTLSSGQLYASTLLSRAEAFERLHSVFANKTVDYYFIDNGVDSAKIWQFYVDADPLKGWEHDCHIYSFNRTVPDALPSVENLKLPPKGKKMIPLSLSNRFVSRLEPIVYPVDSLTVDVNVARHTYALILNGGISPMANYQRYWNDCSFIYQTLRKTYHIPKDNIYVLMSDGKDPADDMLGFDGYVKSSPTDLDFDGIPDITGDATEASVWLNLDKIIKRVKKGDQVLIYVIDHGNTEWSETNSSICLWGGTELTDDQLAYNTIQMSQKGAAVNVVLGQCFSGGFVDDLSGHDEPVVVAAACQAYESSWASIRYPYDEFMFHWTSAINGADPFGKKVNADYNNDGYVSMEEAFNYAKTHDTANETPKYVSAPNNDLGKKLAINRIPEVDYDLIIRDNYEDTGWEPNTTTDIFWNSPDIWIRNEPDGIEEHESPYYSSNHISANVYIKIRNTGFKPYNGGKYALFYWAQSSAAIPVDTWMGFESYPSQTGCIVRGTPIPPLEPGDSTTVVIGWSLPSDLFVGSEHPENLQFSICARISDKQYDLTYDSNQKELYFDIRGDNNFAQKNLTIINLESGHKSANFFIRNAKSTDENYTIELRPSTAADSQLFSEADVKLIMSPTIYNAWDKGGLKSLFTTTETSSPRTIKFDSGEAKLLNICMSGKQLDKVQIAIDYHPSLNHSLKNYSFDIIQRDSEGNIVGGQTFLINSPRYNNRPIMIDSLYLGDGKMKLSAVLDDDNYCAWYNSNGNKLSDDSTLEVTQTSDNSEYTIVSLSADGEISQGTIRIQSETGIKSISPAGAVTDHLDISLFDRCTSDCKLVITSVASGQIIEEIAVNSDIDTVCIDTARLQSGLYVVSCIIEGKPTNSVKFTKF